MIPKGILLIALIWIVSNIVCYIEWGGLGAVVSTYSCMGIIWFGRKIISKWFI